MYENFNGDFLYNPSLNKTVRTCPQLNEAVAKWQNLIWLMDFTQVFPVNLNVFVFTQVWLKFFSFAQI